MPGRINNAFDSAVDHHHRRPDLTFNAPGCNYAHHGLLARLGNHTALDLPLNLQVAAEMEITVDRGLARDQGGATGDHCATALTSQHG